jgi:hypothetical protein
MKPMILISITRFGEMNLTMKPITTEPNGLPKQERAFIRVSRFSHFLLEYGVYPYFYTIPVRGLAS